jgi:2-oxoglutarate dehydrogenase E2 component (dihydrolipoamide succinyltransferase)
LLLQAKKGSLSIEDMDGGTFTIRLNIFLALICQVFVICYSNGGVFGSMFGTPIINPPQSAILGMHGIFDRPVAINGKVCNIYLRFLFPFFCFSFSLIR